MKQGCTRSLVAIALFTLIGACATRRPCADAPPAPLSGGPAKLAHPADAIAFNGHWYKAFDSNRSWHDKQKQCVDMGGYLVCIETEAEQAFITTLAGGRYLSLGATDETDEDTWKWVNGAAFAYTCWMDGQPNNYGGNEHYLATYDDGEWVDVAVKGKMFWMPTGFICEWDQ